MKYQVTYQNGGREETEEFTSVTEAVKFAKSFQGHVQQVIDYDELEVETQSDDPINMIYAFNRQIGLLDKPYDDFLESSFQIEEALEGFKQYGLNKLQGSFTGDYDNPAKPKHLARLIVSLVQSECHEACCTTTIPDVDRLDKACDAVVFAVGSMAKLRLTPDQIREAIVIVMNANMQKLSMPKDEHGKLCKPDNFEGPEVKLQALLDRRK